MGNRVCSRSSQRNMETNALLQYNDMLHLQNTKFPKREMRELHDMSHRVLAQFVSVFNSY